VRVRIADLVSLLPILTRVRGMFDVDADTTAIARHLRRQPLMGVLVQRYPGLRVPGAWDPFEMSVRAVLGESMSGSAGADLGALIGSAFVRCWRPSLVFSFRRAACEGAPLGVVLDRARSI
jgi:3-methyladenine DNA glycosylase/8-oxoguanine DNA glycosylase